MHRRVVGLFLVVATSSFSSIAGAQQAPSPAPTGPRSSSTQFTLRREEAGGSDASAARARARSGDCAGALPAFDAALKVTVDPALRRDRGICHDKLGHPFPAIDDYRAYLTARPDAADAEQIRQRLRALEDEVGNGGASTTGSHDADPEGGHGEARLAVGGGLSAGAKASGSGGASSSASSSEIIGPKPGEKARDYDYYVQQERLADAADKSPLRYGSGFVLGPFVHMPRFFVGDGASFDNLAYAVGGTFRYSTGPTVTLMSELGYAGIGTAGENSSSSGPILMGGVELRLPISHFASDHLLLRGGAGYERFVVSGTRAVSNALAGRFAFGYRHVFGPSLGLEALADGGPIIIFPENGDSRINGVIGLSVAFVVGF